MKTNYSTKNEKELLLEMLLRLDVIIDILSRANKKSADSLGYLDTPDLLKQLHISRKTAATWVRKKLLRAAKVGGKLYYSISDISEMMHSHFERH